MLNRTAQNAVRELHGLGVNDLTADEIVDLHILGEKQERAGICVHSVISTTFCAVGNVVLYPPTCLSADWYSLAVLWFRDAPRTMWWALPFALANGRTIGLLDGLNTAEKAGAAIKDWMKSVTVTQDEIDIAVGNVIDTVADIDRHQARAQFLDAVLWISRNNSELAENLSTIALHAFDAPPPSTLGRKPQNAGNAIDNERNEYNRWRKTCAELAALTGGSVESWYCEDTRLVVHAYKVASDSMIVRAGGNTNAQPQELIDAIRAFRQKVAEIVNTRKEKAALNVE